MIVDTSALIAISKRETGHMALQEALFSEPGLLPAPVFVEFHRVVSRARLFREREANAFIEEYLAGSLTILPFGAEHAYAATLAN